jgi:hypothetical protein
MVGRYGSHVRRAFVALAVALLLNINPNAVVACSCVPLTKAEHVGSAKVIFTGTVMSVGSAGLSVFSWGCGPRSSLDPISVRFQVEAVYKGDVEKDVVVETATSSASCGYSFEVGKRYTVFGTPNEGHVDTGLCNGNVEGEIVAADYGLGAGRPPK